MLAKALLIGWTEGQARGPGKGSMIYEESPDCLTLVVFGVSVKTDEFLNQRFGFGPDAGIIERVLGLGELGNPAGFCYIN